MHIPADIGKDTGGVPQPRLLGRFGEHLAGKERRRPFEEFVAMLGKTRQPPREVVATCDQRILRLLLFVETIEQDAFAQAISRDDDFLRLQRGNQLVEHQGAKRKRLHATFRHIGYLCQRFRPEPFDHPGYIRRLARRNDILMKHMDRVVALGHVDTGKIPPNAADHVEPLALMLLRPVLFAKGAVYHRFRFGKTAMREVDETQRPERQRGARAGLAAGHRNQFKTAAAEISDQPVRFGNTGEHALGGESCLVHARQEVDLEAADRLRLFKKFGAVFRIAHSRRRGNDQRFHADLVAQRHEAAQRLQRTGNTLWIKPSCGGKRAAEARHHLFVEDENRVPFRRRIDDEAYGI